MQRGLNIVKNRKLCQKERTVLKDLWICLMAFMEEVKDRSIKMNRKVMEQPVSIKSKRGYPRVTDL